MKHLKILSAVLLMFTAFNFTSCSEELEPVDPAIVIPDPTDPGNPSGLGVFKVDIDGAHYTASATVVYISGGSIILNALRSQGDNFAFFLNGTTAGTYQANDEDNIVGYNALDFDNTFIGVNFDNPTEDTGSVTVTEVDLVHHTISGTFHFKGYSEDDAGNPVSKQFTNGIFTDLPYTVENPTGDTFFAKVNGSEFVDVDILTATVGSGPTELISIAAADASDASITVSVLSSAGVGTYPVTGAASNTQINYTPAGEDFGEMATSGTVTITEKTATRIKGTFSTTIVVNAVSYAITQGAFDVAY
jgi:hypothetical protein